MQVTTGALSPVARGALPVRAYQLLVGHHGSRWVPHFTAGNSCTILRPRSSLTPHPGAAMKRMLCLALFLAVAVISTNAADDLFEIKPMADGVYAAISKPAYKVNCNAAIILFDDSVLVVDTHSKPSAARALIEQVKKLSDKPVKYVVNTHFHWDHYQGNQAYPSSWPAGVEIISSEATRLNIEQRGIPRVKHEIRTMPADIEKLKAD